MQLLSSTLSITLSAFLLFLIQPLAAKELLPIFGGVPSVWNVCMVFFQGMLLLGYFNTYITSRFFTAFVQRIVFFSILIASLFTLPILWHEIHISPIAQPTVNVLRLLISKLALPLLVLSTTAPLIQYWFGQTRHSHAKDPYFLYSASNIGSFLALLGFPLLFEPFMGLQHLSFLWTGIYCLFVITALCTLLKNQPQPIKEQTFTAQTPISAKQRLRWLLLSFAPSSLLMAVTQFITTDIGSTPFLWVLPLALYLLIFVITFARRPIINHDWMVREQPYFLIFPLFSLGKITLGLPGWQLILFHLLGFFALAMVCVGELVKNRPSQSHLAEFYVWIALGGFLGGVFNSIIAPLIFNGIYEYYIAFCLCLLLRPWQGHRAAWQDFLAPVTIGLLLTANYFLYTYYIQIKIFKEFDLIVLFFIIAFIIMWHKNPLSFATSVIILFCFGQIIPGFNQQDLILQSRNFFGLTRVYKNDDLKLHMLMNGTTIHGVQLLNQPLSYNRNTTYYQPINAIAQLLGKEKNSLKIAIAGLGVGSISCQFRQSDVVTFFEIDPTIVKIAQTSSLFTYLKNCPPRGGVIIDDARLGIAATQDHVFDAIIIDVYSSDAIPTHLFTLNAIQLYLQKLMPDGLLIFNISNRHMDMNPVLTTIAKHLQLQALHFKSNDKSNFKMPSEWIILTNNTKLIKKLENELAWKTSTTQQKLLWTDDYSNIVRILKMA